MPEKLNAYQAKHSRFVKTTGIFPNNAIQRPSAENEVLLKFYNTYFADVKLPEKFSVSSKT